MNFKLLEKGMMFCHSSAFKTKSQTILCPAWRHSGKTNLLLNALQKNSTYLADDWSLINQNGTILGLPKRINLLYYNFIFNPKYASFVDNDFSSLVRLLDQYEKGNFKSELSCEVFAKLRANARIKLDVNNMNLKKHDLTSTPVDYVFLLQGDTSIKSGCILEPINIQNVSNIIQATLAFEQSHFYNLYLASRYNTGHICKTIQNSSSKTAAIIENFLKNSNAIFFRLKVAGFQNGKQTFNLINKTISKTLVKR